jgi:endonuclease YncB( thermonuclease family)
MRHLAWMLGAMLLLLPATSWAWSGKVIRIEHGCHLRVHHDGKASDVVLYGIDCPQPEEPFGERAMEFTAEQALDRTVEVRPLRTSDDTVYAVVTLADSDRSLNALLLAEGLAWVHQAYCEKARMCGRWEHVEGRARKSGLGLWSEVPENMPAWRWIKERR